MWYFLYIWTKRTLVWALYHFILSQPKNLLETTEKKEILIWSHDRKNRRTISKSYSTLTFEGSFCELLIPFIEPLLVYFFNINTTGDVIAHIIFIATITASWMYYDRDFIRSDYFISKRAKQYMNVNVVIDRCYELLNDKLSIIEISNRLEEDGFVDKLI